MVLQLAQCQLRFWLLAAPAPGSGFCETRCDGGDLDRVAAEEHLASCCRRAGRQTRGKHRETLPRQTGHMSRITRLGKACRGMHAPAPAASPIRPLAAVARAVRSRPGVRDDREALPVVAAPDEFQPRPAHVAGAGSPAGGEEGWRRRLMTLIWCAGRGRVTLTSAPLADWHGPLACRLCCDWAPVTTPGPPPGRRSVSPATSVTSQKCSLQGRALPCGPRPVGWGTPPATRLTGGASTRDFGPSPSRALGDAIKAGEIS